MLTKPHIVIPVMFAHVMTSLQPRIAATTRCAASCSQTLKTTASRKEQVDVTISVRCHSRSASHLIFVQTGLLMFSFAGASKGIKSSTPNSKEVSEVPRAQLQAHTDGLCSRSRSLPAVDDSAHESINVQSEKQTGAGPSVSAKHTALSKPRVVS